MTTFHSTADVKQHFGIQSEVEVGDPSYVRHIVHSVFVHNEGMPVSVQIGKLFSGEHRIDESVAKQADELLKSLEKYVESGDHEGVDSLELVILNNGYRLHKEFDGEIEQLDRPTVKELMDFIH
ncbi:hypothetical protein [Vibrio harveyi]|uniref:hypothetical protein n=1 Tax=Vibrio harveyi TaxID=669 RepID=UPI003CE76DD4